MLSVVLSESVMNDARCESVWMKSELRHLSQQLAEGNTNGSQVHLMICGQEDLRSWLMSRRNALACLINSF